MINPYLSQVQMGMGALGGALAKRRKMKVNYVTDWSMPAQSAYEAPYQNMNLGKGQSLGTQALPELGGGVAMGDPMLSSIAARRQRLMGMPQGDPNQRSKKGFY